MTSSFSKQESNKSHHAHPQDDPAIKRLMSRMPTAVVNSFSTEQLLGLRNAISARGGRIHSVDVRPTLKFPFLPWSFYCVFLFGHNRRTLSGKERFLAVFMLLWVAIFMLIVLSGVVLLLLYLMKSALGINIFEGYSLGIWDWFKGVFQ